MKASSISGLPLIRKCPTSILLALVLICFAMATSIHLEASTNYVSTTNDSGPGSLRQAILDANGSGGTILFSNVNGVIGLSSGLPEIVANIDIRGPGTNLLM